MTMCDAVAVFGTRLQNDGTFLPFVYQEIDRAVAMIETGQAPKFIFCGSHWAGESFNGTRECDVVEAYLQRSHPHILPYFLKEERSTTVQENWLYMKLTFPNIRRIHHITIMPFLPRMQFCGDWIYGDEGSLTHEALPWPAEDFPHEPQLLRDAQCIFKVFYHMERGDHTFLLYPESDISRWVALWQEHGNCRSCYPQ